MAPTFNLLKEPWLPCIMADDRPRSLNLMETVTEAHRIKRIQADLPVMTGSLYLFLLAFAITIFRPKDDPDWKALWDAGKFPEEEVRAYGQSWESRFDLFDAEYPFYQDPQFGQRGKDLKNLKAGQNSIPKPLSGLLLHLASGSNATLFDHSVDDHPRRYTPAEAAQLLIMLQTFSLGGMSSAAIPKDKYYKDSPFGRGVLFLNQGQNLFETLLLNMPAEDFGAVDRQGADRPAWENEDPFVNERYDPQGLVDLITWQSRRFLLIPEKADGKIWVSHLLPAPGHGLVETYANPFYQNRIVKSGAETSIRPLRFQMGRSLWRDSTAILGMRTDEYKPAIAVAWSGELVSHVGLDKDLVRLEFFGMCTEPGQKKAYFYAQETFSAPLAYLKDPALLFNLQSGLDRATAVAKGLRYALWKLACFKIAPNSDQEGVRDPSRDDTDPLLEHWNAAGQYWRQLEPAFYDYLFALPLDLNQAYDAWEQALRKAAWGALQYTANQVGTDPASLKACAKAEDALGYQLHKIFQSPEEV